MSPIALLPRCRLSLPILLATLGLLIQPAQAASLVLEDIRFSEVAGDFTITGGERTRDALRLFQDVTGPNVDLFMSIEGLLSTGYFGFRLETVVTNRTNTPWIFYDHELQERFGVASPEEDGLSFAQQFASVRPTSNAFSRVDEVTDVRDFVNYSGGVVNPNETVTFRYFVLDNAPNDLFFLRQRPNFASGGVGTVEVPPIVETPTPVVVSPPPAPVVVPQPPAPVVEVPPVPSEPVPTVEVPPTPSEPVPTIEPEPNPIATVPEPGISLISIGLVGWLGTKLRRRKFL